MVPTIYHKRLFKFLEADCVLKKQKDSWFILIQIILANEFLWFQKLASILYLPLICHNAFKSGAWWDNLESDSDVEAEGYRYICPKEWNSRVSLFGAKSGEIFILVSPQRVARFLYWLAVIDESRF